MVYSFLQLHFNARYILFYVKTRKKNTEWFVISSRHKCFSLVCVFILPCDICEYNKLKAKDKEKRIIVWLLFIFQDWNTRTHTAYTSSHAANYQACAEIAHYFNKLFVKTDWARIKHNDRDMIVFLLISKSFYNILIDMMMPSLFWLGLNV